MAHRHGRSYWHGATTSAAYYQKPAEHHMGIDNVTADIVTYIYWARKSSSNPAKWLALLVLEIVAVAVDVVVEIAVWFWETGLFHLLYKIARGLVIIAGVFTVAVLMSIAGGGKGMRR